MPVRTLLSSYCQVHLHAGALLWNGLECCSLTVVVIKAAANPRLKVRKISVLYSLGFDVVAYVVCICYITFELICMHIHCDIQNMLHNRYIKRKSCDYKSLSGYVNYSTLY